MYIYKITNLINSKLYVGQSSKNINESESYYGSGKIIKRSIEKYGIENFKKEILCKCDSKEELDTKEIYWIEKLNSMIPIGYNLTNGGGGVVGYKHTDEAIIKMSKASTEMWTSQDYLDKILPTRNAHWTDERKLSRSTRMSGSQNPMYGKKHSEEAKLKVSEANTGNTWSEERKLKYGQEHTGENNTFYGKTHTKETREKLSEFAKNRFEDEAEREKIRKSVTKYYETHPGTNLGKTFSNETIEKMKIATQKRNNNPVWKEKQSKARTGRVWINKEGIKKCINPSELETYLKLEWNLGMQNKEITHD